jgi:hypothetical protein
VYQAPEVEHLQRAVDAVKRGLLPEKQTEPIPEDESVGDTDETLQDDSYK